MSSKPILPYSYFVPRIERCRQGMLKHRNEEGTVANLCGHFENRLIKTMEHPEARELRDEMARFLVHNNEADRYLASVCLFRAIRKTFAGKRVERQAFGQFVNALAKSKYRHEFEVVSFIEKIRPIGWTIPMSKTELMQMSVID